MPSPWLYLVPLALLAAGCFITVRAFGARREAQVSLGWPTVPGKVTGSRIAVKVEERDANSPRTTRYQLEVEYAYRVGDRDYRGNRLKWGWTKSYYNRRHAEADLAAYAAGTEVVVHYDPANPSHAVLDPTSKSGMPLRLIVGGALIVAGVLVLIAFGLMR